MGVGCSVTPVAFLQDMIEAGSDKGIRLREGKVAVAQPMRYIDLPAGYFPVGEQWYDEDGMKFLIGE